MKKILLFGNGQIAQFYINHYRDNDLMQAQVADSVDIRDLSQVRTAVTTFKPDVVINTAAKTNLEWCGANQLEAFDVNVLGAANVAEVCDENNIYFIHYSSGCIFSSASGTDVKLEDSPPNPSSYYGWTKVWSEQMVMFGRSDKFKCLILRPRQPVSSQVNSKNMLVKMLTFSKFIDTPNSGTVIEDLMEWTDALIEKQATGVLHVANTGYTTPYKIGLLIKELVLPNLNLERIEKTELDKMTPNIRVDTVLGVDKLQALGIPVRPYEESLRSTIQQLGKNIAKMDKSALKIELEKTATASKQRTVLNDVYEELYKP